MKNEEKLKGAELKEAIKNTIGRVKFLDSKIAGIELERDEKIQSLANKCCPFNVGDTVTICGYSHKGKKGIVKVVGGKIRQWGEVKFVWFVSGNVLTKDGKEGKQYFQFDSEDMPHGN